MLPPPPPPITTSIRIETTYTSTISIIRIVIISLEGLEGLMMAMDSVGRGLKTACSSESTQTATATTPLETERYVIKLKLDIVIVDGSIRAGLREGEETRTNNLNSTLSNQHTLKRQSTKSACFRVSAETRDTSVTLPVPSVPTTARRESSSWVVRLPTPRSVPSVSTLSVSVVETPSSVLSVLKLETSLGDLSRPPASAVSSPSSTTPPTTSWSVPTLSSREPLLRLMPPHSVSGTSLTTLPQSVVVERSQLKETRTSTRPVPTTSPVRLLSARRVSRLSRLLMTSSLLDVFWPESHPAQVSLVVAMVTFLREESWTST